MQSNNNLIQFVDKFELHCTAHSAQCSMHRTQCIQHVLQSTMMLCIMLIKHDAIIERHRLIVICEAIMPLARRLDDP